MLSNTCKQTLRLFLRQIFKRNMLTFRVEIFIHPPMHCNEEKFEGFSFWKEVVQALITKGNW